MSKSIFVCKMGTLVQDGENRHYEGLYDVTLLSSKNVPELFRGDLFILPNGSTVRIGDKAINSKGNYVYRLRDIETHKDYVVVKTKILRGKIKEENTNGKKNNKLLFSMFTKV